MSVKLCLLKTGQTVIGDLKEVVDHAENKTMGYKIIEPYSIDFEYRNTLTVDGNEKVKNSTLDNAGVKFNFWAPLSAQREFNFPYEFIDVIYEPHQEIVSLYNSVVNHYIEENTITQTVNGEDVIITYNQDLEEKIQESNQVRLKEAENNEEPENLN